MRNFFRDIFDVICITISGVFTITGCCLLISIFIYALERIVSFFQQYVPFY